MQLLRRIVKKLRTYPGCSESVIMEQEHKRVLKRSTETFTRQMFKVCTFTIYAEKSHNMCMG